MTAFTRTFSSEITVVAAVAASAVGSTGRSGVTTARYSASPSAVTAWPSAPPMRLRNNAMNPADGPSVRPIIEYSPPVTGHADESSA